MSRFLALGLAAVAVIAGLIVFRGGDDDPYTLAMRLSNAGGLTDGSPVAIGGVNVGTVRLEGHQDRVDVKLEIRDEYAPLPQDVQVQVLARNALGQKQVLLTPGGSRAEAPDGYRLPDDQVEVATDLDQLLGTLDADTRTRLAIVLNETGMTFAGRKVDFKALLTDLAPALSSGADLLGQLGQDNRSLTNLLATSDRFIATMARERARLSKMIDRLGRTTETVATKRDALRDTLRTAPAALSSARSFLAELRRTTGPLAATARQLTATAPSLLQTIDRIEPFRAAAAPTLRAARAAGPSLTQLSTSTRGSLAKAVPALTSLRDASVKEIPGVGDALDGSMDNLLATVENWSRAIQFRDGLGHIFRGEASFAPSFYERIVDNLVPAAKRRPKPARRKRERPPTPGAQAPARDGVPTPAKPKLPDVKKVLGDATPAVKQATEELQKALEGLGVTSGRADRASNDLLDYLLGK
ncbi:MlaD family protein [Paraconexibacter sp.]|uniref:MlaD family protein n=1 Tax=Paraconexibacter sp. TaxID=2949640 RepID=UPI0035635731